MPKYTLYYFNIKGRAEPIRIAFAYGKIKFEDKRLTGEEWVAFKPKTPSGQMPVLEVDGKKYCQSSAIMEYISDIVGLNGKCGEDRLILNSTMQSFDEVFNKYPFVEKDEAVKKQKEDTFFDELLPTLLGRVEKEVKERNGGKAYILNSISRADIGIMCMVDFIGPKKPNILDGYPILKEIVRKTREQPEIKKWIAERPDTPM